MVTLLFSHLYQTRNLSLSAPTCKACRRLYASLRSDFLVVQDVVRHLKWPRWLRIWGRSLERPQRLNWGRGFKRPWRSNWSRGLERPWRSDWGRSLERPQVTEQVVTFVQTSKNIFSYSFLTPEIAHISWRPMRPRGGMLCSAFRSVLRAKE